jgi:hypothetical protein
MNKIKLAIGLVCLGATWNCSGPAPAAHQEKTGYYAVVTPAQNPRVNQLPDSWPCEQGTCLSMNTWKPVPQDWADALAEGGDTPDADTRVWEDCWLSIGDTSYVVCPDGTIETS